MKLSITEQTNSILVTQNPNKLVIQSTENTVDVPLNPNKIIANTISTTLNQQEQSVKLSTNIGVTNIISQGVQGPRGIPEEEVAFTRRIDFVGETLIYKGEAPPGTAEGTNGWRVRRITFVGSEGDIVEEWANGLADFSVDWTNHATHSYF